MLWFLFLVVGSRAMELEPPEYNADVSACVEAISENYLRSKCLAFLFRLNFSDPSVAVVPSQVRSGLLKSIHGRWAPYLPAVNTHTIPMRSGSQQPGALNHLRCAHIVILQNEKSYVSQIEEIIHTLFTNYYQNGGGEKSRMVIVEPHDNRENRIYELLHFMFTKGDIDVLFVAREQNRVNLYSYFPFGLDGKSCPEDNIAVEKLDIWVNGSFLHGRNLFPDKVPRIFNNCYWKISTVNYPPFVKLCSDGRPCDGLDFRIFELISQHMGLRKSYLVFSRHTHFVSDIDGEIHGAVSDVHRGLVWLLMSAGTNLAYDYNCLFVPLAYMTSKTSWFFQNPEAIPNWKLLYLSFDYNLWLIFITSTILFICIVFLISRIGRNLHSINNFSKCIMTNFNVSKLMPSRTNSFRFVFILWLFYVFHIKLAYTASLTCIMTTGKWESKITSFDQILERGLKTVLPNTMFYLSQDVDEPIIKRVLSNSLITDDYNGTFYQMENFRNLTILDEETFLSYKIKQNKLKIYKSKLNIGMKSFGLKMRRNHFIADRIAELSSRVFESGLAAMIIDDYTVLSANKNKIVVDPFRLWDFTGAFLVLISGLVASSLVFLGEIIVDRNLKSKT